MSHVSMAAGGVSTDDSACDIFEANLSAQLKSAFATIAAVSAGRSKGVNAEHLANFPFWGKTHCALKCNA